MNTQIAMHCSGASYPAINEQDILGFYVPLASVQEQLDIAKRCHEIESKAVAEMQSVDAIRNAFQGLATLINSDVLSLCDENQFDFYLGRICHIKRRSRDLEAVQ